MNWIELIAATFLMFWGMLALYSGIKNDGKSRFMILGWIGYPHNDEDRKTVIRIKNIVLGLICITLGVGLLYIQFK